MSKIVWALGALVGFACLALASAAGVLTRAVAIAYDVAFVTPTAERAAHQVVDASAERAFTCDSQSRVISFAARREQRTLRELASGCGLRLAG